MEWMMPSEYSMTRECFPVLFLVERDICSHLKIMCNRRSEDYRLVKYVIVSVQAEDYRGFKLRNRFIKKKDDWCSIYRHSQEYIKNLYPKDFSSNNTALYFQYQRFGATFLLGKVNKKSPFELVLKRSSKSCFWKFNDADMKHAEKLLSIVPIRTTAKKSFQNNTCSYSLQDIANPEPFQYNPVTLNVNPGLYKEYFEYKYLNLEDAMNGNELIIPLYDRHKRFGSRRTEIINNITKHTVGNLQKEEFLNKNQSTFTISEKEKMDLEKIYYLTYEPFMKPFKGSEVKKECDFFENKDIFFEGTLEEKKGIFKTSIYSRSRDIDEDSIYDPSYEPFKTIAEIPENIFLDNVVGIKESKIKHEETSETNLLKDTSITISEEHISNNGSDTKNIVPKDSTLENYQKNDTCFHDLSCPDNKFISNETSENTTKNPQEIYVSNQDSYANSNMSNTKMDEVYENKTFDIYTDKKWVNISSTRKKASKMDTSLNENVDPHKIDNIKTEDLQAYLNITPHVARCSFPCSNTSPKVLKRRRIPKPIMCVEPKLGKNSCIIEAWLNKCSKKTIYKSQSLDVINWEDNTSVEQPKQIVSTDSLNLDVASGFMFTSSSQSEEYEDEETGRMKSTQSDENIFVMKVEVPSAQYDQTESTIDPIKQGKVKEKKKKKDKKRKAAIIKPVRRTTFEDTIWIKSDESTTDNVPKKRKKDKSKSRKEKGKKRKFAKEKKLSREVSLSFDSGVESEKMNVKVNEEKQQNDKMDEVLTEISVVSRNANFDNDLVLNVSHSRNEQQLTEDIQEPINEFPLVSHKDKKERSITANNKYVEKKVPAEKVKRKEREKMLIKIESSNESLLLKMTSKKNDNENRNEDLEIDVMMGSKVDYDGDSNKVIQKHKLTQTLSAVEYENDEKSLFSQENVKKSELMGSKVVYDYENIIKKQIIREKEKQQKLIKKQSLSETFFVSVASNENDNENENLKEDVEISVMMGSKVSYNYGNNKSIQKTEPTNKSINKEKVIEQKLLKKQSSSETFLVSVASKEKECEMGKEDLEISVIMGSKIRHDSEKNKKIQKNIPIEKSTFKEKEKLIKKPSSKETFIVSVSSKENEKEKRKNDVEVSVMMGSKGGHNFEKNKIIEKKKLREKNKFTEKSTFKENEIDQNLIKKRSSNETLLVKITSEENDNNLENDDFEINVMIGSNFDSDYKYKNIQNGKSIMGVNNNGQKLMKRQAAGETLLVKITSNENENENKHVEVNIML